MALKANKINWLGKVKGHVGQANTRFKIDAAERKAAGEAPKPHNIILTNDQIRDMRSGEWDAARVLMTTLGGELRTLTANDLAQFQRNMNSALNAQGKSARTSAKGITPRQVIDLAGGRKKRYSPLGPSRKAGYDSDIDKARREITQAIPVSMVNDTIRFLTPAGKDSKHTRHAVIVRLHGWEEALSRLASVQINDEPSVRRIANWLRKQRVSFDCDCERHRYFFRYVATLGGFNAGRREDGFPKITNPGLMGVACKHVLRVMTELESSGTVLQLLVKHLMSVKNAQAKTQLSQKAAEQALKEKKSATKLRTSEERKTLNDRAKERRAMKRAQLQPTQKPSKRTARSAKVAKFSSALIQLAKEWNMKPEDLQKLLEKRKA